MRRPLPDGDRPKSQTLEIPRRIPSGLSIDTKSSPGRGGHKRMYSTLTPKRFRSPEVKSSSNLRRESSFSKQSKAWDGILMLRVKESLLSELKSSRKTGIRRREVSKNSLKKYRAFTRDVVLGEGAYGVVYRSEVKDSSPFKSLKKGDVVALKQQAYSTEAKREFSICQMFRGNQYVVQMMESFSYKGKSFTAMELMESDLENHVVSREQFVDVAEQIIRAISVVHDHGIIHRDLKLENLFIRVIKSKSSSDKIQCKIGDFGLALPSVEASGKAAHPLGICPEMMISKLHVFQSDVFAVGILLLQLACYSDAAREENDGTLWLDVARLYIIINQEPRAESFRMCLEQMVLQIVSFFHPKEVDQKRHAASVASLSDEARPKVFHEIAERILKNAQADKRISGYILAMLRLRPKERRMPRGLYTPKGRARRPLVFTSEGTASTTLQNTAETKMIHRPVMSKVEALKTLERIYKRSEQ